MQKKYYGLEAGLTFKITSFLDFKALGTELIAAVILNADRIILQAVDGGTSVTVFYAATLIGKMVSLISMPLNGVIIGHLSKYNGKDKYSDGNIEDEILESVKRGNTDEILHKDNR